MPTIAALDTDTLATCSLFGSLAFASLFLCFWLQWRTERHLLFWSASSALYALMLLGFDLLPSPAPLVAGTLLYAGSATSNALILAGVHRFAGTRAVREWMAVPIVTAMLLHALPRLLRADGLPLWEAIDDATDSIGLAVSFLAFGTTLVWGGRRAPPERGRRIAGLALLAYVPTYAAGVAGAFLCPDAQLLPKLPLLADQMLLALLNLGLLAMVAERAQGQLRDAALRDPLTGCWNRSGLDALEGRLTTGAQLLAIDVDRFKQVNDRHGHAVGDRVLQTLAAEAQRLAEPFAGEVARIGGDEFVVLLPGAAAASAVDLAEQLRKAIAADAGQPSWTVSIGRASLAAGETPLGPAVARADASLYRAKAGGRDRIAA